MKLGAVFFSDEAEEVYQYLLENSVNSKFEKTILRAIDKKIKLIEANPHYGNLISKRLIPKEYKLRYRITNLLRVELPHYWRMLYTLKESENEIEIIAFVLDIIDHKKYNKKFGYRKK